MEHSPTALEVYFADSVVGWLNDIDSSWAEKLDIRWGHTPLLHHPIFTSDPTS